MRVISAVVLGIATGVASHDPQSKQADLSGPHRSLWYNTLPGDGGTQADSVFSGISTFGRLPYFPCLSSNEVSYDLAFIGLSALLPGLAHHLLTMRRCSFRHGDIISTRRSFWAFRYPARISTSESLVKFFSIRFCIVRYLTQT
jgi:hypothetical protein